jgi:hypothetical protein
MGCHGISAERRYLEDLILKLEPLRPEDGLTRAQAVAIMRTLSISELRKTARRLKRRPKTSALKPLAAALRSSTVITSLAELAA